MSEDGQPDKDDEKLSEFQVLKRLLWYLFLIMCIGGAFHGSRILVQDRNASNDESTDRAIKNYSEYIHLKKNIEMIADDEGKKELLDKLCNEYSVKFKRSTELDACR